MVTRPGGNSEYAAIKDAVDREPGAQFDQDWYRETFELKCAGLSREQLSASAVPPSAYHPAATSLDDAGTRKSTGEPISLRRIVVDMIAEYARHSGHADLLRACIDGATGR